MMRPRRFAGDERRRCVLRGILALCAIAAAACGGAVAPSPRASPRAPSPADRAFLDTLEERTFRYFWELGRPKTGLVPDRAPTPSFSSIAAVGFGLSGYVIG